MKELSIEQKAKRYNEAIQRARQFMETPYLENSDDVVGYIFPELKESEDERIRKALLRFHKSTIDIDGIKGGDILAWLEKQVEQKPALDEEDETTIDNLVWAISNDCIRPQDREDYCDWLKSLKDRVHPKPRQEWSMYDETILKALIDHFEYKKEFNEAEDYDIILWLKSLRPQNTWKPSEEQMETLHAVSQSIRKHGDSDSMDDYRNLTELYNELVKLM